MHSLAHPNLLVPNGNFSKLRNVGLPSSHVEVAALLFFTSFVFEAAFGFTFDLSQLSPVRSLFASCLQVEPFELHQWSVQMAFGPEE